MKFQTAGVISALASPPQQVRPACYRGMLCCARTHSRLSGFQHRFKGTTLNPDVPAVFFIHLFSGKPALTSAGRCLSQMRNKQHHHLAGRPQRASTHLRHGQNTVVSGLTTKKSLISVCLTYKTAFVRWPKYTPERKC